MANRLDESVRATADANGRAVAELQVGRYHEQWHITGMTTQTTSESDTELRVYRGSETASGLVASTYSGNLSTAGGSPLDLRFGDKLTAVWANATPGAICTLTVWGDRLGR